MSTAIAHLALSSRPKNFLNATHYDMYFTTKLADDGACLTKGRIALGEKSGLGLFVDDDVLGTPVFDVS